MHHHPEICLRTFRIPCPTPHHHIQIIYESGANISHTMSYDSSSSYTGLRMRNARQDYPLLLIKKYTLMDSPFSFLSTNLVTENIFVNMFITHCELNWVLFLYVRASCLNYQAGGLCSTARLVLWIGSGRIQSTCIDFEQLKFELFQLKRSFQFFNYSFGVNVQCSYMNLPTLKVAVWIFRPICSKQLWY